MADKRKDAKGRNLKTGEYYNSKTHTYQFRVMKYGKRYTITAKSLTELRKKENELLVSVDRGNVLVNRNNKMALDDYFDFWLETFAKSGRKATTCTNYKSYYSTYIRGELGRKAISKITKVDCQLVFNKMIGEGRKHSTMTNLKSCLNKVFECAIEDGILARNPVKNIELPQTESNAREAISEEQITLFMSYVKESPRYKRYYPLFVVLFNSGMRIGELSGLTWDDIDFKEETISINKTMNRYRKKDYGFTMALGSPKSKTSVRTIIMNEVVKTALRTQRFLNVPSDVEIPYLDDTGRVTRQVSNFVFFNSNGNVWCEPTIREVIRNIVTAQNKEVEGTDKPVLLPFCPHMVRHTFTSVAYSAGADVKVVSGILGHASTAITLDRYTHLTEEKKKEQKAVIKTIRIS